MAYFSSTSEISQCHEQLPSGSKRRRKKRERASEAKAETMETEEDDDRVILYDHGAKTWHAEYGPWSTKDDLFLAILQHDNEALRSVLSRGNARAGANTVYSSDQRMMPLHFAAQGGNVEIVRTLLAFGANVNSSTQDGLTPLHYACLGNDDASEDDDQDRNYVSVVKLLIESGADVETKAKPGVTPLWAAANCGFTAVIRVLVEVGGANVDAANADGKTPLCCAIAGNHIEAAQYLIHEASADFNIRGQFGDSALEVAAKIDNVDILNLLLDKGALIDARDCYGQTTLHAASQNKSIAAARTLIQRGADVHARDNDGLQPLHLAVYVGSAEMVKLLLDCGVDVNAREELSWKTPIQLASKPDVASVLLDNGADLNVVSNDCSPLLFDHTSTESCDVIRLLLKASLDGDVHNIDGDSLLMAAAVEGNLETVQFLLESGVDIFVRDKHGRSVSQRAAYNGHTEVADFLDKWVRKGRSLQVTSPQSQTKDKCTVDSTVIVTTNNISHAKNLNTPLHSVLSAKEVIDLLHEGLDVNAENISGLKPLHYAAKYGLTDVANCLIDNGADVNATDFAGNTALHEAATFGLEITQLLVTRSALINMRNLLGKSSLHSAVENCRKEIALYLLSKGADLGSTDCWTNSAIHYASHTIAIDKAFTSYVEEQQQKVSLLENCLNAPNFLGISAIDHLKNYGWKQSPHSTSKRKDAMICDVLGNNELHRTLGVYGDSKVYPVSLDFRLGLTQLSKCCPQLLAERNLDSRTPLHVARGKSVFKECLRNVDKNFCELPDDESRSFWHLLLQGGYWWNLTAEDLDARFCRKMIKDSDCLMDAFDVHGRTALHYVAMTKETTSLTDYIAKTSQYPQKQDDFGRTPLHYTALCMTSQLTQFSTEDQLDLFNITPDGYKQKAKAYDSQKEKCRKMCFVSSMRVIQNLLSYRHETLLQGVDKRVPHELVASCRRLADGQEVNSATFVWNIWKTHRFSYDEVRDESVRETIKNSVCQILKELLKKIGNEDDCFTGRLIQVGSSYENSKVDSLDELDFMVVLDRFSDRCDVIDDAALPTGYFYLRSKGRIATKGGKKIMKYFDERSSLLNVNMVKLRFEALLKKASIQFQKEHSQFSILSKDVYDFSPFTVGSKIELKFLTPIDEGDVIMHSVSVDLVPSIFVASWQPTHVTELANAADQQQGTYFIFDQAQRKFPWHRWSHSNARIDFSLAESNVVRTSPHVIRAAYIVVKQMTKHFCDYSIFKSFVLKSAVLHCMQDNSFQLEQSLGSSFDDIDGEQLLFWTKAIIHRLLCFVLQDFVPSVFLPSFKMPVCSFEPHLKFMHMRLHQYGFDFGDLMAVSREGSTNPVTNDSWLMMTMKVFLCCHMMYFCLLSSNNNFELKFPAINPLNEIAYMFQLD